MRTSRALCFFDQARRSALPSPSSGSPGPPGSFGAVGVESFRHAHGAALIGHHFEFEHAGGLGECANLLDVAFQIRAHARVLAKHEHAHAEFAHKLAEEESERFLGERDGIAHNEHIVDVHAAEHAQPRVHAGDGLRIMHAGRHVFACMCLCIGVHECRAWIEHDDHRVCVELLAWRTVSSMTAWWPTCRPSNAPTVTTDFFDVLNVGHATVAVRSWCQTKKYPYILYSFPVFAANTVTGLNSWCFARSTIATTSGSPSADPMAAHTCSP